MSVTDAEAIADVADRLFEAIEQSDIAMVEQLWNEDIIVWRSPAATATGSARYGSSPGSQHDHRSPLRNPRPPVVRRRFCTAAHPARQRPQRRIDRDAGLHRDQVGRKRIDQSQSTSTSTRLEIAPLLESTDSHRR